jgi:hypothetical protein
MYELCDRCGAPTIDVVDDRCCSCGHQNRVWTLADLLTFLIVALVVGGALALAMGWWS